MWHGVLWSYPQMYETILSWNSTEMMFSRSPLNAKFDAIQRRPEIWYKFKEYSEKIDLVFDIISANCSNLQPVTPRIGTTGEP